MWYELISVPWKLQTWRRMVGGGWPRPLLYLKFWVNRPCYMVRATFARSASAVTPIEKVQLTHRPNRKSTTLYALPMSLRCSSYVAPKSPKGGEGLKTQNIRKSHFYWRKSATKFLCLKTDSDKVVRHSLAYPYKNDWCGRPNLKFLVKLTCWAKSPIFGLFSPQAPA